MFRKPQEQRAAGKAGPEPAPEETGQTPTGDGAG